LGAGRLEFVFCTTHQVAAASGRHLYSTAFNGKFAVAAAFQANQAKNPPKEKPRQEILAGFCLRA
jgi:hypothetical protein